jgi:hypothetical protein
MLRPKLKLSVRPPILPLWVVAAAIAACAPTIAQDRSSGDLSQALNDIAAHRRPVARDELSGTLRRGLASPDPAIRQRALLAVASRAGGPRFGRNDVVKEEWREDRPVLVALRPLVVAALTDPDPDARRAAVLALGNMDFDVDRSTSKELSQQLVDDLVKAYSREESGRVRTEIVKGLALSSNDSPELQAVIAHAL